MAVITTVPNHYKYLLKTKQIDESSDVYKIILMDSAFAFDKDTHALLADVTANQLSTGFGYTQNAKVLAGVAVTENDSTDKATTIWSDATWTANGGDIGPTGSAVIYNDTHANKPVAACVDFGADFTTPDGFSFQIQAPELDIA
jgi:hypothetical protein